MTEYFVWSWGVFDPPISFHNCSINWQAEIQIMEGSAPCTKPGSQGSLGGCRRDPACMGGAGEEETELCDCSYGGESPENRERAAFHHRVIVAHFQRVWPKHRAGEIIELWFWQAFIQLAILKNYSMSDFHFITMLAYQVMAPHTARVVGLNLAAALNTSNVSWCR